MTEAAGSRLRVTLVQLAVRDGEPEANISRAIALIGAAPPADLYLLPELWTTGYAHQSWPDAARRTTPDALQALGSVARRTRAFVVGSMVTLGEGGTLANRLTVVGPGGDVVAAYDKAHLFAPMGEPRFLRPGDRRARYPIGPFTAGLSICFDLRFPEMYRLDALDGADLFLIVSAWPAARIEAMGTLAAARAAENQAFVVLCNRAGTGADGTAFGGESRIIGPDGTTLARGGVAEDVIPGVLQPAAVRTVRGEAPLLGQRMAGVDWPA